MTILYLADIRFPLERANGIQTMHTCHALAARGHRVTLGVRPDVRCPPRDPFEFYGLPPVPLLAIAPADVRGPAWMRRLGYLRFARCHARRGDHDVVLTRDLTVADVVLRRPPRRRPPLVYESHGFAPVFAETMPEIVSGAPRGSRLKQQRLLAREGRVWQKAEGYVTTTQVLADELIDRFGPRDRLATVANGVRISSDRRFTFARTNAAPVATYAGHLYPWKGADVFVRALSRLSGVRGLVMGGHPAEPDLERMRELARALGLETRVTFTGLTATADVAPLLARSDVLVLPTTATPSARYTSPLKLFEYMAAGRPIVASNLSPIREIVQDGEAACLVEPGDPEALATGIRRVLDDEALAERIARTAFDRAPAYAWERRAERLEALLNTVVERLKIAD